MTITLNRNVLLFLVLLVALGVGGYVIGTRLNHAPASTAAVPGAGPTAVAGGPAAVAIQTAPAIAPADTAPRIDLATFKAAFDGKEDMLIVDVRTPELYASGHIAGAVNIPEAQAQSRMAEMPKDKKIVLYCA